MAGQTLGNGAVGQFVTKMSKAAGYKTLSIVRTEDAAARVLKAGGDVTVVAGDGLAERVTKALDGQQLDLVIDGEGGETLTTLAQFVKFRGDVVAYSALNGPQSIGVVDLVLREGPPARVVDRELAVVHSA